MSTEKSAEQIRNEIDEKFGSGMEDPDGPWASGWETRSSFDTAAKERIGYLQMRVQELEATLSEARREAS